MRILYFSRDYGPHDHRFLSALAGSGNQIYYLRLERSGRQTENRPVPGEVVQVEWSGGRKPVHLLDGSLLLGELHQVLHKIKPDVVHAGPIQSCGLLAALVNAHPLLVMSWGFDLMKDAERNSAWRWATRYTLKHADWFTSDCETTRNRAILYGMPSDRTTVFPWGVNLNHFRPSISKPSQKGIKTEPVFTLLCNRSWEPNYGVDVLVRAFVLVCQQRQGVRLLLLGGGSQADLLMEIIQTGGVQDKVELGGQVSYADLPGFYHMANLYVSPSHVDGSSVSLMEAMACGLPCLVSDIPANREWVQDGQNGWLFPDGEIHSLAKRILLVIENQDKLTGMGEESRRIAEQRADWKKNFGKLLEIYDLLVKKKVIGD